MGSSHARDPAAGKATAKPKRPATSKKTSAPAKPKPKRSAGVSRAAARTNAIAASTQKRRPAVEPKPEVRSESTEASRALALAVAKAGLDKKAVNVQIVDVVGRVDYTDFLVLMSGRSDRHVLSVADAIEEELSKMTPKRKPEAVEGRPQGSWVVLDFGEVVAHVFQEDVRSFYDLDTLWQDARKVPVSDRNPNA